MTGHVFIYGAIGTGPGEVSVKNVQAQIDQNKQATDIEVHFFSPGGDVFEGYAIYNALSKIKQPKVARIEGLCASIATLDAFACDRIIMDRVAEFMIHNPKISDLSGDSKMIRGAADQLDKIKNILVDVAMQRAQRNGKSITKNELWALYDKETWLNAQETQAIGFADEVVDAIKAVAKVNLNQFKMENQKAGIVAFFTNLFSLKKFRNEFTETLANGRVIVVISEDENWTGKQVVTETGEPLEPGEHPLMSGKILVIGDNSTITEVKEAQSPEDKQKTEEMDNKIKELEAQLTEAKNAKATAEAQAQEAQKEVASAKAEIGKIQNKLTETEKTYLQLKEETGKTVGDITAPPKGPVFKNVNGEDEIADPMGEEFKKSLQARNLI